MEGFRGPSTTEFWKRDSFMKKIVSFLFAAMLLCSACLSASCEAVSPFTIGTLPNKKAAESTGQTEEEATDPSQAGLLSQIGGLFGLSAESFGEVTKYITFRDLAQLDFSHPVQSLNEAISNARAKMPAEKNSQLSALLQATQTVYGSASILWNVFKNGETPDMMVHMSNNPQANKEAAVQMAITQLLTNRNIRSIAASVSQKLSGQPEQEEEIEDSAAQDAPQEGGGLETLADISLAEAGEILSNLFQQFIGNRQ